MSTTDPRTSGERTGQRRPEVDGEQHSPVLGPMGFMASMGLPAAIGIVGIAVLGFGAIDWLSAIVWGAVATVVFTAFSMMGKAVGMTRMDLDLLGSAVAEPDTSRSRLLGAVMHHVNGALLALFWAYGVALVDLPPTGGPVPCGVCC